VTSRGNPVGWALIAFFFVGGIVFWIALPDIFIGQIWVAVSLLLALIFGLIGLAGRRAARLKTEGIRGQATILGAEQTGVYVNEQPQVKLTLRVEASGIQPFEIDKSVIVPLIALGRLSSGTPLTVYIDRENRERFVIDWSAGMAPAATATDRPPAAPAVQEALRAGGVDAAYQTAAADPQVPVAPQSKDDEPLERLTKLMQLKGAQLITDAEFEEHKKRILEEL
jgi:hypothetical protein